MILNNEYEEISVSYLTKVLCWKGWQTWTVIRLIIMVFMPHQWWRSSFAPFLFA